MGIKKIDAFLPAIFFFRWFVWCLQIGSLNEPSQLSLGFVSVLIYSPILANGLLIYREQVKVKLEFVDNILFFCCCSLINLSAALRQMLAADTLCIRESVYHLLHSFDPWPSVWTSTSPGKKPETFMDALVVNSVNYKRLINMFYNFLPVFWKLAGNK